MLVPTHQERPLTLTVYSTVLEHLAQHAPTFVDRFITAMVELGVIELMARGISFVKEPPGEIDLARQYIPHLISTCISSMTPLVAQFNRLFHACILAFSTLERIKKFEYLEATFEDLFVEWLKALRYLRVYDDVLGTQAGYREWHMPAIQVWIKVGQAVGYNKRAGEKKVISGGCAYVRCPDPDEVKSSMVRFECPCNNEILYCGLRCQQA